ncbi:MAG: hypothetical protein QXE01_04460 [Sulfolobales archaeon]
MRLNHSLTSMSRSYRARISYDSSSKWDNAVIDFIVELRKILGPTFRGLIAYEEGEEFYESNVLVILSKMDQETMMKIMEIKFAIEDKYRGEITISPYIALEGEEIVTRIKETARRDHVDKRILEKALEEFREEALKIKGIVDIIIPGEEFYESNVLVILSKMDQETMMKIMEIKFAIEDKYRGEITISPYIALEGEEIVTRIKETARRSYKGSRDNVL